jgi:hypothetical protein
MRSFGFFVSEEDAEEICGGYSSLFLLFFLSHVGARIFLKLQSVGY